MVHPKRNYYGKPVEVLCTNVCRHATLYMWICGLNDLCGDTLDFGTRWTLHVGTRGFYMLRHVGLYAWGHVGLYMW